MNESPIKLVDDQRFIHTISSTTTDADGECNVYWRARIGVKADDRFANCDKIVVYYENGQMAGVPWFAVYDNNCIIARVDAASMEVEYLKETV